MFDPEQQVSLTSMEIDSHVVNRSSYNRHKKSRIEELESHASSHTIKKLYKLINPFAEEPATPDLTNNTKNLVRYIAILGLLQTLITNLFLRFSVVSNRLTDVEFMAMYFLGLMILLVITIQIRYLLVSTNEWIILAVIYLIFSYLNYCFTFGFSFIKQTTYTRVAYKQRFKYMEYRISGLGLFFSTGFTLGYALLLAMGQTMKYISPKSFFSMSAVINLVFGFIWIYPKSWEKNFFVLILMCVLGGVGSALVMAVQVKFINAKLRNGTEFNISECIYMAVVGRYRAFMSFVVLILKGLVDLVIFVFYY